MKIAIINDTHCGIRNSSEIFLNYQEKLVPENLSWNSTPPTLPDQNGRYKIPVPGVTKIL